MGYLVGIDCGGGKTVGTLCDRRGRVLARVMDRGGAIIGMPGDDFFAVLDRVLNQLLGRPGAGLVQVEHVAIGLSGVDYPDEQADQQRIMERRLQLAGRLTLVNDGVVALWGVSPAARSALVQHGTGMTTAYRSRLGDEQVYDSLDVAEVYDVRRRAFALTARMIDGRAERTALCDRVLSHCGVAAEDFSEWAFRRPEAQAKRLSVSPVIFAAWRDGDPAAAEMVECAAADYVLAAKAMGDLIGGRFEAAFGGGVIVQGGAEFQQLLKERLRAAAPLAEHALIRLAPERGALVLAGHRAGLDAATLFHAMADTEQAA